jgi:hypothetical protein
MLAYLIKFLDSSVTRWNDKVMGVIPVPRHWNPGYYFSNKYLRISGKKKAKEALVGG